jgi:hypothetical protein
MKTTPIYGLNYLKYSIKPDTSFTGRLHGMLRLHASYQCRNGRARIPEDVAGRGLDHGSQ